jgi:hypothetical protein
MLHLLRPSFLLTYEQAKPVGSLPTLVTDKVSVAELILLPAGILLRLKCNNALCIVFPPRSPVLPARKLPAPALRSGYVELIVLSLSAVIVTVFCEVARFNNKNVKMKMRTIFLSSRSFFIIKVLRWIMSVF